MIDTNKLIPKRKEGARLSEKTITSIGLIKKDVVKIDSLLKEKLVLSKVRYGILRQQNERDKRLNREKSLEGKKSRPQDFGFNMISNKKGKGFGGFLGGILKSILGVLGFSIFRSLPGLIRVGRVIKTIAVPFTALVGVAFLTLRTIVNVGRKISADTRGLDPNKINKDAVNKGINNFSTELVRAAQAFAAGVAGGIIVQRLVKGRLVGINEAEELGARRIIRDRAGADAFVEKVARESGASKRSVKRSIMSGEFDQMIFEEQVRRRRTTKKLVSPSSLTTGSMIGDYQYDSTFSPRENINRLIEFEKQKELNELLGRRGRPSKKISQIRGGQMTLKMAKGIKEIEDSTKIGTVTPDDIKKQNLLVEEETLKRQKKLAETAKVRIDKSGGGKIAYDFSGFEDPKIDMEELARLDAEMKEEFGIKTPKRTRPPSLKERMSAAFDKNRKKKPRKMTKAERLAQKAANQRRTLARAAAKEAKERAAKLATKKGLSRLLFKFGGEALEQSVKQVVKQSVGVIPLIGDLIGFLLDIFLFKQPVGRAAFMASGSILGGIIGGVLGLVGGPPGVLVGSIVGGIGGDLLGGAFYDLIVGRSTGVVQQVGESAVKKTIKAGGLPGFTLGGFTGATGGFVHAGEFVIDADSTLALERGAPGFLMALNKASGSGAIDVLRSYAAYETAGTGTETLIPLPFEKIVTRTIVSGGEDRDTGDFTSPFMDLYRRG
tara:strand:+ start:1470 stop:3629 length:2160 start_codon:yes stop_codon:yes gene_type:complete